MQTSRQILDEFGELLDYKIIKFELCEIRPATGDTLLLGSL